MAFVAYRTWTTGELVTAAMMNQDVRDNGIWIAGSDGNTHAADWTVGGNGNVRLNIKSTDGAGNSALYLMDGATDEWHVVRTNSDNTLRVTESGVADILVAYPGGGIYAGRGTPSDPGASNLRVQGNVIAGGTQARVELIGEGATYGVVRVVNNGATAFEDLVLRGDDLVVELGSGGSVTEFARLDDAGKVKGAWAPRTFVPAEYMYTGGTAGTWAEAVLEATDTSISTETRKFDAATDEKVEFKLRVPTNYAGGSITITVEWFANATTGAARWSFQTTTVASGAAMTAAPTERQVGNFTTDATANERNLSTLTWSATLPAAGDLLLVRFVRDADNAGDTLAVDAELLSLMVEWGS